MLHVVERGIRHVPESSWLPIFQRSIDAFYEGRLDEGRDACLVLLAEPGLPSEVREQTYRNQTFYAQALTDMIPRSRWHELEIPDAEGPIGDGPSPVLSNDRLMVFVRVQPGVTEILSLDHDLRVIERSRLADDTGESDAFEQIRPFVVDRLQAAVIIRPPEETGHRRAGVVDVTARAWCRIRPFGPRAGDFQRGWSPFVSEDSVHLVAWWEPTEVFRHDAENGAFERVALRMAPHVAERFSGASQGVAVPGGFLFLVNEQIAFDQETPLVFSRFLRIDESFQIEAISPQFFISDRGGNVASGLARQGDRLIAGFSSSDQRALLATVDVESVLATLMPVAAPGSHAAS